MNNLIGLDIGTSSVKGILMTEDGKIKKVARGAFEYTKLENGGVEIAADDFINVCFSTIRELADAADDTICGICASSASGNLMVADENFSPMTPIINWQDKRIDGESAEILKGIDFQELYKKIGWGFDGKTFPLAQLCYIKKHQPKLLDECGMVCASRILQSNQKR